MKNVLFITYDFPYPTTSGGNNRAYHMLKYAHGHKRYLFSFKRNDFSKEYIKEIEKLGVEVVGLTDRRPVRDIKNVTFIFNKKSVYYNLYFSKEVLNQIVSIIKEKKIDVVHFESFFTAPFICDEIKALGVKQIYGSENIEFKMYEDYAANSNFFLKPLIKVQAERIRKEEEFYYSQSDLCVAVSDPDADFIRRFNKCEIVRNGVDIDTFKYKAHGGAGYKLLFVGNFLYFPNIDAINYFYKQVFVNLPENFKLTIIGKKVHSLPIKNKQIEMIEFIPDIAKAYDDADIMVSPVRLGGGTNFKIIEAMAAGLPVVALPDRLEGLDVTPDENIIVVNNSKDYRDAIIKLAENIEMRIKISKEARKLVEEEYSWEKIGKALSGVWENI